MNLAHRFVSLMLGLFKRRSTQISMSWRLTSLLICAFVAIPIVTILLALLSPGSSTWAHIKSTILTDYVLNSLLLMLQVGIYTLVIGVSTAWLTAATEFPGRRILSWALMLPLAAPAYITAYVYTDLLEFSGPVQSSFRALFDLQAGDYSFPEIRSLNGAAIIIGLVLYPYVYLLARASFTQHSTMLFDAARTLGAKPSRAFFRIALPSARPAIVGGVSLVLMETLADFGVVDYFGVPTFSTGIFRTWFSMGEKAAAMKLAAVMFVFVILLVVLEKNQRRKTLPLAQADDAGFKRITLKGMQAWLALLVCTLPVILGCVIPLTVLAKYAIQSGDPLFGFRFIEFISNSVWVAGLAALIAVAIALVLTYANVFAASRTTAISIQIATLGYAIPGIILAVGLLAPISMVDIWLADFLNRHWGWQVGLILTGTAATLVYAYVVRFLTVAFNSTSSGLAQIPASYGHVARSLGLSPHRVIYRIHLPLMRSSIFAALILVFVDTMRELPATLLLRPFGFETLATRVYRLASDERLADASTAAICIVLIGLIPVLMLNRLKQ